MPIFYQKWPKIPKIKNIIIWISHHQSIGNSFLSSVTFFSRVGPKIAELWPKSSAKIGACAPFFGHILGQIWLFLNGTNTIWFVPLLSHKFSQFITQSINLNYYYFYYYYYVLKRLINTQKPLKKWPLYLDSCFCVKRALDKTLWLLHFSISFHEIFKIN